MVERTGFDQASALLNRLMEKVGGSADAYEDPLPVDPGVVLEEPSGVVPEQEEPTPEEDSDEERLDGGDVCCHGVAVMPDGRNWIGNPPPVTDDYESHGIVDEAGELLWIHRALMESYDSDEPQTVKLETGETQTEKRNGGWVIKDEVKDRLYCQEDVSGTYEVVGERDVFIWVLQISDSDADLGYIHEGYVFLHK